MEKKKPTMSREQAAQLYDELKEALERKHGKKRVADLLEKEARKAQAVQAAAAAKQYSAAQGAASVQSVAYRPTTNSVQLVDGSKLALFLVVIFAAAKLTFSVLEVAGIWGAETAAASQTAPMISPVQLARSAEEKRLMQALDARRAELEDRNSKLDIRAADLDRRDREFAARLTELRDLSQRLKLERQKDEKKQVAQLDQLANVYGSMNPQESAQLMEQLDLTIALSLIERMPEKRIGQILSLMSPDRALTLTRMLSRQ